MNLSSFQKPSRYINTEVNAVHKDAPVKVALAFPDIYEIGMSHLGLKILYKIINDLPYASAERVFSPWVDLEAEMREKGIMISSLESNRPLKDFDIVGFSLQYELSFTTVLNMLHLGGIPVKAEDRGGRYDHPLVIAGGPCTVNPMPMSPFIDAFLIGDGEDAVKEIMDTFYEWKTGGDGKKDSLLRAVSEIGGVYVPALHDSSSLIRRRIVGSLEASPYPDQPVVPYTSIVHDRVNIEVSRGCPMGCRFCQAGMIYRPVRERSAAKVLELAEKTLRNTGYEEVAFTSLSAGDYTCLLQVVKEFNRKFEKEKIALSLPSLRVASINNGLLKEIRSVRKTGFTIAPEAGTDRLRRAINKDFTEEDYEQALRILFEEGWLNLKLYFMIGLPTETMEDIAAIPKMAVKALKTAKRFTKRFVNINVGISPFVPKAHTPFQWYGQNLAGELREKKKYIKDALMKRGFNVKGHDINMSLLEAAFSRGDKTIGHLIEKAWQSGCRLDGWSETFDFGKWKSAMDITGIDAVHFATRTFDPSDVFPWENINTGVTKDFLWKEYRKALSGEITTDCRKICHKCGLDCHRGAEEGNPADEKTAKLESICSTGSGVTAYPLKAANRFKPVNIRVEFSKTGRLRHLSHFEVVTLFHRAMRRAGFPLQYSQGFHPAPRTSFGPPLGVGVAGLSEYFDMEIIPPFDLDGNKRRLNGLLPEGVSVIDMAAVSSKAKSLNSFIMRYEYEVKAGDLTHMFKVLSEREINVNRERGPVNIRGMLEEARPVGEDKVRLLLVDQGEIKVRLGEILPAIFDVPVERLDITRTALYGWKGGWVRPIERSLQWTVKY